MSKSQPQNPVANRSTSIWDYKPSWCQPWSIVLTGLAIITASWLILHLIWITAAVSLLIVAWWVYFLIIYPRAFANYLAAQNQNSTYQGADKDFIQE